MNMNVLTPERRIQVVAALVEGNLIRSVSRMTGVARNTIMGLLVQAGAACAEYQDKALRNLPCKRVQCDEIWSFCYGKDKNLPGNKKDVFGYGSVWTWTAIDADTKLVCWWMVGNRDTFAAREFIQDLAGRLASRIQLTTDGHKPYLEAVDEAFGGDIDYAMLIRIYGDDKQGDTCYSPAECTGTNKEIISGSPDRKKISTSYVERQNLTMRMHMRRFTRLTNAFSKKLENHIAAISLHFMYYNFVRIHQTLRVTPAMAAGVTQHVWEVSDIVSLLDEQSKSESYSDVPYGPALGYQPQSRRR
jgi:IS1 family transposase